MVELGEVIPAEPVGVRYVKDDGGDIWTKNIVGVWEFAGTQMSWDDVLMNYGPLIESSLSEKRENSR